MRVYPIVNGMETADLQETTMCSLSLKNSGSKEFTKNH